MIGPFNSRWRCWSFCLVITANSVCHTPRGCQTRLAWFQMQSLKHFISKVWASVEWRIRKLSLSEVGKCWFEPCKLWQACLTSHCSFTSGPQQSNKLKLPLCRPWIWYCRTKRYFPSCIRCCLVSLAAVTKSLDLWTGNDKAGSSDDRIWADSTIWDSENISNDKKFLSSEAMMKGLITVKSGWNGVLKGGTNERVLLKFP